MNREIDIVRAGPRELALPGAAAPMASANPQQVDRIDMRWLMATLRRRRKLLIATTLGVFALALLFTLLQTPVYVASSHVVLNVNADQIVPDSKQAQATDLTQDSADTEIQVLQSRDLAERAATRLQAGDPKVANALIDPQPGIVGRLRRAVAGVKEQPQDAASRHDRLVEAVLDHANIQRTGTTFAVSIAFAAQDPHVAAVAANEIADTYTNGQFTDKRSQNQEATGFLSKRLEELRQQANADNASVQGYRIANNLLSTSGASLTEQEISSYNQRVADARTEAAGDQARLATARRQLRNGSTGDDVGEAMVSPVIGSLRAKQAEVSGRLAAAQARHGDLAADVVKAKSELADVNAQIEAEIKRVMSNLEAKSQVSAGRLGAISGTLAGARGTLAQNNRAGVQLTDLQRKADASQQLYETYLNRYKELSAKEGTEHSDARMISHAVAPTFPSSPNLLLNAALGLLIGLGLGLATVFGVEVAFSGLTNGEDVERRLGLRYLGGTPLLRRKDVAKLIELPIAQPNSLFSNALHHIRSSIVYASADGSQVFALTSALPGEAKTATSIALARSISLGGDTVVILDCDFRRRRMSKMVQGMSGSAGLLEVLSGKATLAEAMIRDERSGAWLLPIIADGSDAGRLMTGEAMDRLLTQLRAEFRFVILDTPPILAVPETVAMLAKTDAAVMLVRWRRTADHAVRTALRMLPPEVVRVLGVVLTAIDVKREAGLGVGDASYYYNQYKNYLN